MRGTFGETLSSGFHDCETLPLFGFLVGAYSFSTHMVGKFLCQTITLYLGEAEVYIASSDVD